MMGCACDERQLLGELMGALLPAGSRVRVGFAYEVGATGNWETEQYFENPNNVRDTLRIALLYTGEFESVTVTVTPPRYTGIVDGYIIVEGVMAVDKGNPEDVGGLVEGVLHQVLSELLLNRRDAVIYTLPSGQTNDPGSGTPRGAPVFTPTPTRPSPNCPEGMYDAGWFSVNCKPITQRDEEECDFDKMAFDDWLACVLGISSGQAVVIGALGAVLAIALIAKR